MTTRREEIRKRRRETIYMVGKMPPDAGTSGDGSIDGMASAATAASADTDKPEDGKPRITRKSRDRNMAEECEKQDRGTKPEIGS